MSTSKLLYFTFLICSFVFASCTKDFLDKKPDKSLLVPTKLDDFQAIMDNSTEMNQKSPGYRALASDEYYALPAGLSVAGIVSRNSYIWAQDTYEGISTPDWDMVYQQVFWCNIVLEGLEKIKRNSSNQLQYDLIKGSALFFRGQAFYNLSESFTQPYDKNTADQHPGVPLKLTSDVNERKSRGTLAQTFSRILDDLRAAESILPLERTHNIRPSKHAAMALLARVYLTMENYGEAERYAGACLNINNSLIDYNTLSVTASRPFPNAMPRGNEEIIHHSSMVTNVFFISGTHAMVDPLLYNLYDDNDLRKHIFFLKRPNGITTIKGHYSGTTGLFTGLANDELYLIRAECYARRGELIKAMGDLNELLINRWTKDEFSELSAADKNQALNLIFLERRKELVARGRRWSDLRRLNKYPEFATTLTHELNGEVYTLKPGDNRYVFPIPDKEIHWNPLVQPNP